MYFFFLISKKLWKLVPCFTFLNLIQISVTFLLLSLDPKSMRTTYKSFCSSFWVRSSKCLNTEFWCKQEKNVEMILVCVIMTKSPQRVELSHSVSLSYSAGFTLLNFTGMYWFKMHMHISGVTASSCLEARNK